MMRPCARIVCLFALLAGGCGPAYVYRTDDTVYVVLTARGQPGEEVAKPADHQLELHYVASADVEVGGGDRLRLLFDLKAVNQSTLPLDVERRGIALRDSAGGVWTPVQSPDGDGPWLVEGGSERVLSLAFDLPESFEFELHPRMEMEIPYSVGGGPFLSRVRLVRDRLPEPVYYRPYPRYYYHDPYWYDPWYAPGPPAVGGSFFYYHH